MDLFDWAESDRAKDEGMDRVENHANGAWLEAMYFFTVAVAHAQAFFTSDDVFRHAQAAQFTLQTRDNRAFGPVMSRAAKAGVCVKARLPGVNSERVTLHSSPRRVWKSLIYQMPMSSIDFAGYVKAWRKRHGLSEQDAGAILGISTVSLYLWEHSQGEPRTNDQAFYLARMQAYTERKK